MMEYTAAKIDKHWEFQGLKYNATGEGDLSDFSLCMVYVYWALIKEEASPSTQNWY